CELDPVLRVVGGTVRIISGAVAVYSAKVDARIGLRQSSCWFRCLIKALIDPQLRSCILGRLICMTSRSDCLYCGSSRYSTICMRTLSPCSLLLGRQIHSSLSPNGL